MSASVDKTAPRVPPSKGYNVTVTALNDSRVTGVFHSAGLASHSNNNKDFNIILSAAKELPNDSLGKKSSGISKHMILPSSTFESFTAENVPLIPGASHEQGKKHIRGFATDHETGAHRSLEHRAFVAWDGGDAPALPTSLTLEGSAHDWDQFAANKKLHNVRDTYDESLYTTRLDTGKLSAEQIRQAERIAREIEGEQQVRPGGAAKAVAMDVGTDDNEEMLYGAVVRQAPGEAAGAIKALIGVKAKEAAADVKKPSVESSPAAKAEAQPKAVNALNLEAPPGVSAADKARLEKTGLSQATLEKLSRHPSLLPAVGAAAAQHHHHTKLPGPMAANRAAQHASTAQRLGEITKHDMTSTFKRDLTLFNQRMGSAVKTLPGSLVPFSTAFNDTLKFVGASRNPTNPALGLDQEQVSAIKSNHETLALRLAHQGVNSALWASADLSITETPPVPGPRLEQIVKMHHDYQQKKMVQHQQQQQQQQQEQERRQKEAASLATQAEKPKEKEPAEKEAAPAAPAAVVPVVASAPASKPAKKEAPVDPPAPAPAPEKPAEEVAKPVAASKQAREEKPIVAAQPAAAPQSKPPPPPPAVAQPAAQPVGRPEMPGAAAAAAAAAAAVAASLIPPMPQPDMLQLQFLLSLMNQQPQQQQQPQQKELPAELKMQISNLIRNLAVFSPQPTAPIAPVTLPFGLPFAPIPGMPYNPLLPLGGLGENSADLMQQFLQQQQQQQHLLMMMAALQGQGLGMPPPPMDISQASALANSQQNSQQQQQNQQQQGGHQGNRWSNQGNQSSNSNRNNNMGQRSSNVNQQNRTGGQQNQQRSQQSNRGDRQSRNQE